MKESLFALCLLSLTVMSMFAGIAYYDGFVKFLYCFFLFIAFIFESKKISRKDKS